MPIAEHPTVSCSILVVDDQPEFLQLARALLNNPPGLVVVGEATSGPEALALLLVLKPDVVVLDVQMPGMSGFETARRLLAASPGLCIIMVSAFDEADYEALAYSVGAAAFLTKKEFSAGAVSAVLKRTGPHYGRQDRGG